MTNRDKITNEKLARMIMAGVIEPCNYCILKDGCYYSGTGDSKSFCIQNIVSWLEKEVEKTDGNK